MERWCVPALKCTEVPGYFQAAPADNIRLMSCEAELNVFASIDAEPVNSRLTTPRTTAAMIEVIAIKFTSAQERMAVAAMFGYIAFVGIVT